MAGDRTNSKFAPGSFYPSNAIDTDHFPRYEPLISPTLVRQRFLLGLPDESFFINHQTGKPDRITDPIIQDAIIRAVGKVEQLLKIDIFQVQRSERHPFDRNQFNSFGYLRAQHKPIQSVDDLSIIMANGVNIYTVNTAWIDNGGFMKGRLNIVPLTIAAAVSGGTAFTGNDVGAGAYFISVLGANMWVPAFFTLKYTTGFPDGRMPIIINELIGMTAALDIMQLVYLFFISTSYSIGLDAQSQSQSFNPQLIQTRLELLKTQRDDLAKSLKGTFGTLIGVSTL
jgi:hypothetical protein